MAKNLVCFCQMVDEKEIVEAIHKKGAKNLRDIQLTTSSSTRCGRCIKAVDTILVRELPKVKMDPQLKLDF